MKKNQGTGPAKNSPVSSLPEKPAISDDDIYEAMKQIESYLDITTSDFKELYHLSYRHAMQRLTQSVRARDIMTRDVVTVAPTTPLAEVAERMANAFITGVPVLDEMQKVVGIVSEQDFLKHMGAQNSSFMSVVAGCLRGKGCAAVSVRKGVAADIMTKPAITIREDVALFEIAAMMSANKINRLPVLAETGDNMVGILTRNDLISAHLLQQAG
mgnify:CR=1 FL=1